MEPALSVTVEEINAAYPAIREVVHHTPVMTW